MICVFKRFILVQKLYKEQTQEKNDTI
jgi:hypothetical protein